MKRLHLLPALLLFITFHSNAQEAKPLPKVEIDFKNSYRPVIPSALNPGEFFEVVVKNINPNLYSISIESQGIELNPTPLSTPLFTGIDLSSISDLIGNFSIPSFALNEISNNISDSNALNFSPNHSLKVLEKNNELLFKHFVLPPKVSQEEMINENIQSHNLNIEKYALLLFSTHATLDSIQFELLEAKLNRLDELIIADKYNRKEVIKLYLSMREQISEVNNKLSQSIKLYETFTQEKDVVTYLKDKEELKKKLSNIGKDYLKLQSKVVEFQKATSTSGIEKQLLPLTYMYSKNGYTSLPIQFNKDIEELKINFTPKITDSSITYGLQSKSFGPILIHQKNKYYWSVGTSIYFSGLSDQRVGSQLTSVNDSTNQYTLFKEDELKGELGAALLLRAGRKICYYSLFGYHLTFGTGLSIGNNVQPRFIGGAGISVGKKHNLVLDVGGIGGYVDEISKNIDFNQSYVSNPQPMVTQLRWSYFISIGYAHIF